MKSVGLVDSHAYSLIAAFEFPISGGSTLKLVKIRNPWGFREWAGDWSDKSTKWTAELKALVGFEDKEDGIFFISFQDYIAYFYVTTICKYIQENDVSTCAD